MKSSNCCFAKAPEGQVPPSKTASGTVAHELIAASTFWTALNAHLANVPAGGDPPAIPAVQFGVVLRI
ncbi:MAG TPA: hypothetical protein VE263_19375 [Candidatus Angelobacter sp.]|nr:hypothetical protein [Candidatus Angelobacter sp.]